MAIADGGALAGAVSAAGMAGGVCLLIWSLRSGGAGDPTRPPSRLGRTLRGWRSAAGAGRLVGGVLGALVVLGVSHWPVAAVGLGVLIVGWPRWFGGANAEQAQITRLEALVTWTESLRDTIAAHASLEQAIPATARNAPPAIHPALVLLVGQIQARVPMDAALQAFAADLDDPSADLVIAALILNVRRRGDRLGEVLTGLTQSAREELDLRRRVSAGRAGLRRGAQIVVLLTVAFAVFLVVFGGAYTAPYATPLGQVALAVVIAMFVAGFAWMRALSAREITQPFLARPGHRLAPQDMALVAALMTSPPPPGVGSR